MLVGKVPVAGMTAAALSKFLVEQTSHRLCEPKVMDDLLRFSEDSLRRRRGWKVGRDPMPLGVIQIPPD